MAYHLFGAKPLPEPMITYCQLDTREQNSVIFFLLKLNNFQWNNTWNSKVFILENAFEQSGGSPKVVALFSATNFSSYIIELLQLHDTIQI